METIIGILILTAFIQVVHHKRCKEIWKNEKFMRDSAISNLTRMVERFSPRNPCEMHICNGSDGGYLCMKHSTYLYGSLQVCDDCAKDLLKSGVNPPPTEFKFSQLS